MVDVQDPLVVFGAIAALIFLGFLGNVLFSRFRINDTLLLIGIGVILGPVLGLVPVGALNEIRAIVGPLALILILFDGGLALQVRDLKAGLGGATVMAVVGFSSSALLVAGVVWWALEVPFMVAFILGAILAGTSAVVVMPSLAHIKTERRTATMLSLESALTDVLVVVVSFSLISVIAAGALFDARGVAGNLAAVFVLALIGGGLAGALWIRAAPIIRDKPFGYMMTLGAMFALYVGVEWFLADFGSGGGPLAVLAFGIVLGNIGQLGAKAASRAGEAFQDGIKRFQGEVAFLVRTFFFIYLGALIEPSLLLDQFTIAVGIMVFLALLAARYLAVATVTGSLQLEGDRAVLWCMMPRGLAAAVLAAEPLAQGIPGTAPFVPIAFMILVLSNVMSTVGGFVLGRERPAPADQAVPEPTGIAGGIEFKEPDKKKARKSPRRKPQTKPSSDE